ncbi:MAG: hypothetical protein JWR80_2891 [Bradyrhizobium sp.]|nr:hypothetical protein [Bradyrhizobium sp.]
MSQVPPELITNSRLTMIGGQAFFEHLNDFSQYLPDRPWLPADYGDIFGKLRGGPGHSRYAFPWRDSQRSAFWREYAGSTALSQISAEQSIELLIPLRLTPAQAPVVRVTNGRERLFFDVYGYPHGPVVALTVQLPPGVALSPDDWRDRLRALRLTGCYDVTLPGAAAQTGCTAKEVLDALLEWYRPQYYGAVKAFTASSDPFSIVAVIQGQGVDSSIPLATRADLQRILNAVTAWPVNWEAMQVPPLAEASLPVSSTNVSSGDALYAAKRGRTLWRPALFTYRAPAGARLHTLSCLMHNHIAGAVQAESLRLFAVGYAATKANKRGGIPARLRANVATQIDRLWRGDQTYRSSSIKLHLEDKSSLAQVNLLFVEMGLDAIS